MIDRPTMVLVHGAFADSSSWAPVAARLLDKGYAVRVPAVPNRGLRGDATYIRSVVEQIPGPVLLAGHSYGGAVITVAGAAENVVGLVYVSAYALEAGETAAVLQGRFSDSELPPHLVFSTYPTGGGELGTDVLVDVDAYPGVVAAGVPVIMRGFSLYPSEPLRQQPSANPPQPPPGGPSPAGGSSRRPTAHSIPRCSGSAIGAPACARWSRSRLRTW